MAADLTNQEPKDTYKSILHLDNYTAGLTAALQQVYDGDGTASVLWLSTTEAQITNVTITGGTISGTTLTEYTKTIDLAAVALSNDYNDLDNTPSIPTQYTDEMAQDAIASLIQNGTGITWSYNDGANTLTPTVTITQYTDELAQDAVGSILTDSTTIDFTYDDATPSVTASVKADSITSSHIDETDAANIRTSIGAQASDATLAALAAYNNNGLLTQTAADTFTGRTITGTANEVTVTNGDGVSGNPAVSLPATIDLGGKTSLEIPNSAAPTVDADGEIAVDTSVADFSHGLIKYYSGEELGVVAMPIAKFGSPTNGHVVSYNSTNDEFELVAQSGGSMDIDGLTQELALDLDNDTFPFYDDSAAANRKAPLFYVNPTLGYVSGNRYIFSMFDSVAGANRTNNAFTNGNIEIHPIVVSKTGTFSGLAISVATLQAASEITACLYASNSSWTQPTGDPIANSETVITTTATGERTGNFGANITLTPGIYWIATQTSTSATCVIRVYSTNFNWTHGLGYTSLASASGTVNNKLIGYSQTNTYSSGSRPTIGSLSNALANTTSGPMIIGLIAV
jgi:hypothetical protein